AGGDALWADQAGSRQGEAERAQRAAYALRRRFRRKHRPARLRARHRLEVCKRCESGPTEGRLAARADSIAIVEGAICRRARRRRAAPDGYSSTAQPVLLTSGIATRAGNSSVISATGTGRSERRHGTIWQPRCRGGNVLRHREPGTGEAGDGCGAGRTPARQGKRALMLG